MTPGLRPLIHPLIHRAYLEQNDLQARQAVCLPTEPVPTSAPAETKPAVDCYEAIAAALKEIEADKDRWFE